MTIPRYVYLVEIKDGTYKIGMSKDLYERMSNLEMDYGHQIVLLHYFYTPHPRKWELFLHKRFESVRCDYEKERFWLSRDDVEDFCRYQDMLYPPDTNTKDGIRYRRNGKYRRTLAGI